MIAKLIECNTIDAKTSIFEVCNGFNEFVSERL